nr:ATP-binding protein [Ideonella paludis]
MLHTALCVKPESAPAPHTPHQRVVTLRRDYNRWVTEESLEDYALRFTPRSFRRWSASRVAHTAFGGASSFLVLELIGATLLLQHGFVNAFAAILATGLVVALAGWPISVMAARHGLDMDLLTRGAGFGYLGSTLTSLIYASFTFIFFALEAAVMAYALELALDIPPAWGYLLCALVVLPLVLHGISAMSRLQVWTQPLWLLLLLTPYAVVLWQDPDLVQRLVQTPAANGAWGFDALAFGAAWTVGMALITQMGEQADTLRFMPAPEPGRAGRWWWAVALGGPGWVVPGVLKMLGGALLATLVLGHSIPAERAVDPNQMYLAAWEQVFSKPQWAVAVTALFVVISQLKINVVNAYAGSLAWSNFFARLTHSHPGRVVWVVFNTGIALLLMELEVFSVMSQVLGLYANVAIAWFMTVVADLVVNKPLGLSPKGLEFRRAYLPDINPVGVGAFGLASALSVLAHLGVFGAYPQAFSGALAGAIALLATPLLGWLWRRHPALARQPEAVAAGQRWRCVVCERHYEAEDMATCPAYGGHICSLCCTLDARCHDRCKPPEARLSHWGWRLVQAAWPQRGLPAPTSVLGRYLLSLMWLLPATAAVLALLYQLELRVLGDAATALGPALRHAMLILAALLSLGLGVAAWWWVLAQHSRRTAEAESERQTEALMREIDAHRQTDLQLQRAREQADQANQAKTRYITTISHELRTPLNSILGYAQLLEDDPALPAHRRQAVSVIRRGGDHLLSLIEGTLDIARIEAGKLQLQVAPFRFADGVAELASMMQLQAQAKGIRFECDAPGLPDVVRGDERRLRQILLNLLGNAVKFTDAGRVVFRVRYAREMARIEIEDSGPGMGEAELARVFEPFVRGSAAGAVAAGGTGLGLTISKMLTDLMGGEMSARSQPGVGSVFSLKLFLPEVRAELAAPPALASAATAAFARQARRATTPEGRAPCILVVDNEAADRQLLRDCLAPLGFQIEQAASGEAALAALAQFSPDAVFMDLAMPGIDGWETIRRLREQGLSEAPLAIISANAFDKGLDHAVPFDSADFLVKPVRLSELLAWLERRLALVWQDAPEATSTGTAAVGSELVEGPAPAATLPADADLRPLQHALSRGHVRGVQRALADLATQHPASSALWQPWRSLADRYALDALSKAVNAALHPGRPDRLPDESPP